jgi:hypothetical protein
MDTILGIFVVVCSLSLLIGAVWGAGIMIRDHTLLAFILLFLGGFPLLVGAFYALYFDKGSARRFAWIGIIGIIILLILVFIFPNYF